LEVFRYSINQSVEIEMAWDWRGAIRWSMGWRGDDVFIVSFCDKHELTAIGGDL
jgi:hypothetical protein